MKLKRLKKQLEAASFPALAAPELVAVAVPLDKLYVLDRFAASYGLSAADLAAQLLADTLDTLEASPLVDDLEQQHYVSLHRRLRLARFHLDASRQAWSSEAAP